MRPDHLKVLLGSLLVTLGTGEELSAQPAPSMDCVSAAKAVAKGRVTREEEDAFHYLSRCGVTGARALAASLAHYTTETDIEVLDDFMHQVDSWRDASIFDAVMRLVTNPAASAQARVFGVRHLVLHLGPHFVLSYSGLSTRGADTTVQPNGLEKWTLRGCSPEGMISARRASREGEPLPAGYGERIRNTLSALASSGSTPVPVRNAARCGLELVPR